MPSHNYKLFPFSLTNRPAGVDVSGKITRQYDILTIIFEISGPLNLITIPVAADKPTRKNRLWDATCFELFIKEKESDSYWEYNLSPSGHWNVYRFDDYRKGMAEETTFSGLPFHVSRQTNTLRLDATLNLKKLFPSNLAVQTAVSAVIKSTAEKISFWALTHPGPEPDFHQPDSFILEL